MKTIVAPVAFDGLSENAAYYAASLAEKTGARVILLHLYTIPLPAGDIPLPPEEYAELLEQNKNDMNNFALKIQSEFPGVKFEKDISGHLMGPQLSETIKVLRPDLVVMGVHHVNAAARFFSAANVGGMIEHMRVPMLIVPAEAKFNGFRNIVLTVDYLLDGTADFTLLREIAAPWKAAISLLTIVPEKNMLPEYHDVVSSLQLYRQLENVQPDLAYETNIDETAGIIAFIKKQSTDLVVMIHHRRNLIERIVERSITKTTVYAIPVPVLVLPEER